MLLEQRYIVISTGCGVTGTGLQLLVQRYTVTGTGVDCVTGTGCCYYY